MAGIIRAVPGYVPGAPVIFLVPALGRTALALPVPEQYLRQVADLLGARVFAVASEFPSGELSEATAVFDPVRPVLEARADGAGGVRVVSLRPDLQAQAGLDRPARPEGALEAEVFAEAFSDGSLGLLYPPGGDDQRGGTYPVSPGVLAAVLAPVLAGRPFVIEPVVAPGTQVSQARLAATIAEVHAQVAVLTGGDPALAVRSAGQRLRDRYAEPSSRRADARYVVRRLRLALASAVAQGQLPGQLPAVSSLWDQIDQELRAGQDLREGMAPLPDRVTAGETVLAAGDAVAGLYAAMLAGAPLPQGWVADVQHLGGLWIRPAGPAEEVAAERAELVELPEGPVRGLVVVGLSGRAVPEPVWEAVRQALERVPELDRAALTVLVFDSARAAHHLAGLVEVEESETLDAPRPADPAWQFTALPALPRVQPPREVASRGQARNFLAARRVPLPAGMTPEQAMDALAAVAVAAGRPEGEPAPGHSDLVAAGLRPLPPAGHPVVYARSLPGAPDGLGENAEFTLDEPAIAQARIVAPEPGGTVFRINAPSALGVSALVPMRGLVIFPTGTSFRVTETWPDAGGTVIELAQVGGGGAGDSGGAAIRRPLARRDVQYPSGAWTRDVAGQDRGAPSGAVAPRKRSRSPESPEEEAGPSQSGKRPRVAGPAGQPGTGPAGVTPEGHAMVEDYPEPGSGPDLVQRVQLLNLEAAGSVPPPAGWEWLDEGRGLAVPADPVLTGGVATPRDGWQAAVAGPGRDYAVHLPTGIIALADRSVLTLTRGWVADGGDLVHLSGGYRLVGDGGGVAAAAVADGERPALAGLPQLDRGDLLRWLAARGVLAGEVPGVPAGRGWQQVADEQGGQRWMWNGPGGTVTLPPGLGRGRASGAGLRCLIDSLSQLLGRVLPEPQRAAMTPDFLAGWLGEHLPVGGEAYQELLGGQMIDVHSVLPVLTRMFQVRVQVFSRAATADVLGPAGMRASALTGPAVDQDGHPVPVLHLYWAGSHFEPLFAEDTPGLPLREPLGHGPEPVRAAVLGDRRRAALTGEISVLAADPRLPADARQRAAAAVGQAGQAWSAVDGAITARSEPDAARQAVNGALDALAAARDELRALIATRAEPSAPGPAAAAVPAAEDELERFRQPARQYLDGRGPDAQGHDAG